MSLSDELRKRTSEDSPHRLAYYEAALSRIGSEVAGNAKCNGERFADLIEQIDALRKSVAALTARVDRMAEFLTELKKARPDGDSRSQT